jgi:hypothetical protein
VEGEPELVIVHVEIQRERVPHFGHRMWQYYVALRQRENKPVIPIALVFYAGRDGIAREEYEEAVFSYSVITACARGVRISSVWSNSSSGVSGPTSTPSSRRLRPRMG